ncbi:threonine synthase [Halalkalicoccus paucihalophilus]|uniref:Threonine synthase n=1 Tax=Halalkalicoccus paucihalophilus TaxID=1008153 RepID=A0A151A9C4_9EURY|nr:threonine/serine dehydratase [Halalkalicoccus paucihalophilus]KYH24306.1 threonine synthase [Halalkalicoccus paucihalophilus]
MIYEPIPSPDGTTIFSYHDLMPPTLGDIYEARSTVHQYLPATPLVRSEYLSAKLKADVYLKREDTLPTGAFKVRGGINLCSQLDEEFRKRGLIAASTGNHGQSVAYAGRVFDIPVTVAVPDDPNPSKVAAIERFGATVHEIGQDYDAAREWAEEQAQEQGYRYIHSANEPLLIAGVGTAGLEVLEEKPNIDTLICPVGGGSSAAGYCLTVGEATDCEIISVQSENADAMYQAWQTGDLQQQKTADTYAEGLQSRVPFALTTEILRENLANMITVSDDAIRNALQVMIQEENLLLEGAAAAGVAAALAMTEDLSSQTVVIQLSGRNISMNKLSALL